MKKIFLTGDSSQDWLIFSESYLPPKGNTGSAKNWENNRKAEMHKLQGGVLLLNGFLKSLLPEDNIILDSYLKSGRTIAGDTIQTIAEVSNISDHPELIHVKKFLGYSVKPAGKDQKKNVPGNFPNDVDLIIIDDVGNDMRHSDKEWIKKMDTLTSDFHIIYKTNWPLQNNELLNELVKNHSDRIIAVVNADDLREHGLTISRKLSWDKTVEDFLTEFPSSPYFKTLRKCHSLIVRFGLEAVICVNNRKNSKQDKSQVSDSRLYYLPMRYEGQIKEELKINMQGMTSAFVAAFTKHFLNPYQRSDKNKSSPAINISQSIEDVISSSIIPGMHAAINCLTSGYSRSERGNIDYSVKEIFKGDDLSESIMVVNISGFLTYSSPRSLLNLSLLNSQLLVHSVAFNYVINGKSGFLDAVPSGTFNKLVTYDREEVEDYKGFKKIVSEYLKRHDQTKPMAYAVFGPPGAGKSYVIKQIISSIGGDIELIERNISQFESYDDLIKTFQISRDISLKGKIPLIFFDEFDSNYGSTKHGWLKYFLAPMQEGVFKEGEAIHPLGKGIFVFAGGISETFEKFIEPMIEKASIGKSSTLFEGFKESKGPDFISRLKGFINIKGINQRGNPDELFSLRRAMILRHHLLAVPDIKNKQDKIFIDNDLLGALLEIPDFEHGARSLEAIINMSDLQDARSFTKASLPSGELLNLHLNQKQFQLLLKENYFPTESIEIIAQLSHEKWLIKADKMKTMKETAKPWDKLDEDTRESNRQQVLNIIRRLDTYQYKIRPDDNSKGVEKLSDSEIEEMAIMEHARWTNAKIAKGWTYGKPRNAELKIHDCLLPYDELDETTKDLDRDPIRDMPGHLRRVGFVVVRTGSDA